MKFNLCCVQSIPNNQHVYLLNSFYSWSIQFLWSQIWSCLNIRCKRVLVLFEKWKSILGKMEENIFVGDVTQERKNKEQMTAINGTNLSGCNNEGKIGVEIIRNVTFFFKIGQPRPLFVYFQSFQTNIITIFTTNICEKCPSSIRCRDSNPRPSERESLPITTRPGLPPIRKIVCTLIKKSSWMLNF